MGRIEHVTLILLLTVSKTCGTLKVPHPVQLVMN